MSLMPVTLSEHFSFLESYQSQYAARHSIDNMPPVSIQAALYRTAMLMEKVRQVLKDQPIHISSWYRCHDLNAGIGGVPKSQHTLGEAVDFTAPSFGDPLDICRAILEQGGLIRFDQLILEHTWVHISQAATPGAVQRGEVLSLLQNGKYASGLTDPNGKEY